MAVMVFRRGRAQSSPLRSFIAGALLLLPAAALPTTVGPLYPPPQTPSLPTVNGQTVTFSSTDTTNAGLIGRAGGVTWTFSAVGVATAAKSWWGPGPVYPDSSPSSYIFEYNTTPFTFSSISGNKVVYSTPPWSFPCINGTGTRPVYQRFTMTYNSTSTIVLDSAATAGISDGLNRVGYVVQIAPGMQFSVNMLFEASSDNATWTPGIPFFSDPCFNHPFQTNFEGGFYYNNAAPTLGTVSNQTVYLSSGAASQPVGPLNFTIGEDGDPNQVTFANIASSNQAVVANGSITVVNNGNGTGSVSFTALPQTYGTQGTTNISFSGVDGLGATSGPSSFSVLIDQPPFLDTNSPLTLGQGASRPITQALLHATDPDTSNPTIFQVQGQPHTGTLYLNGAANPTSFTQTDVNNGVVTYTNNNSCQTSDNFQFQVFDSDGGFANDPSQGTGPTTYSFGITVNLTQTAPTAVTPAPLQTGLGASVSSNVQATTTDCGPPAIKYQFNAPAHGNLTNTSGASGAFTYTPNLGFTGTDTFTFTGVTYGSLVSAPATVSITVANQPPTAQPGTVVTHINTSVNGALVATDPDLPAQTLTYATVALPIHGLITVTNANTGAFTYVPNPGFAGTDSFTFTANDGRLTSNTATMTIQVRQYPRAGDVLVSDHGTPPSIVLFDPASGQQSILSDDPMLKVPYGIAVKADGNLLVTDGGPGSTNPGYMLSINPVTGAAGLFGSVNFSMSPVGLALEASGSVLVGDTSNGAIVRLDGTTGAQVGSSISLGAGTAPAGIAVAGDGTLWVADAEVFIGGATNNLYHVNADGSSPTIISSGNYLNAPTGVALFGTTAYISTIGPFLGSGNPTNIVSVDTTAIPPVTQSLLTSDGNLAASPGIVLAPTNHLYLTSLGNASIVDVNPVGGAQTVLTQGGLLQSPFGLAVVATPTSGVDLAVAMTAPNGYIHETKPLVYTITVRNFGPDAASAATISAATPPNVTGLTWTCTTNGSGTCGHPSGNGTLSDSMSVPVGAVLTYTVTATAGLPETFTLYSVSVQPGSGITDVNLNNNVATSGLSEKIFADGFGP